MEQARRMFFSLSIRRKTFFVDFSLPNKKFKRSGLAVMLIQNDKSAQKC